MTTGFEYRNTDPKLYTDLGIALAGGTIGAGGVTYANTNPKAYIDAEVVFCRNVSVWG